MTTIYATQATAIGGRSGSASSIDGRLCLPLARPLMLGGVGAEGTNPEQLFAAAHAASFLEAIRRAATGRGVALTADSNVTAKVRLSIQEDASWRVDVVLVPDLPGVDDVEVARLLRAAARQCPYTLALQGRTTLRIRPL